MPIYSFGQRFQNSLSRAEAVPSSCPKMYTSNHSVSPIEDDDLFEIYKIGVAEGGGCQGFYKKAFIAYRENKDKQKPEVFKTCLVALFSFVLGPISLPFSLYDYCLVLQKNQQCKKIITEDKFRLLDTAEQELCASQVFSDSMSTLSLGTFLLAYVYAKQIKVLTSKHFSSLKTMEFYELLTKQFLSALAVMVSYTTVTLPFYTLTCCLPVGALVPPGYLADINQRTFKLLVGQNFFNRQEELRRQCQPLTTSEFKQLKKTSLLLAALAPFLMLCLSHLIFLKQRQDNSFLQSPLQDAARRKYSEGKVLSEFLGIVDPGGKAFEFENSSQGFQFTLSKMKDDPVVVVDGLYSYDVEKDIMCLVFKDLCFSVKDLVLDWNEHVSEELKISSHGLKNILKGCKQPDGIFWKEDKPSATFFESLKQAKKALSPEKIKELDVLLQAFDCLHIWRRLNKKVKGSMGIEDTFSVNTDLIFQKAQDGYFKDLTQDLRPPSTTSFFSDRTCPPPPSFSQGFANSFQSFFKDFINGFELPKPEPEFKPKPEPEFEPETEPNAGPGPRKETIKEVQTLCDLKAVHAKTLEGITNARQKGKVRAYLEKIKEDASPYELLGLEEGATPSEIKRACRNYWLVFHSDKHSGEKEEIKKACNKFFIAYSNLATVLEKNTTSFSGY